jgi:hypothetical protein
MKVIMNLQVLRKVGNFLSSGVHLVPQKEMCFIKSAASSYGSKLDLCEG